MNPIVLIVITSGLVGTSLCEKLVRCTAIGRIYALVRKSADGETVQERLEHIWRQHLPKSAADRLIASKIVVAVEGDISSKTSLCGLSGSTLLQITKETEIVIHSAADISLVRGLPQLAGTNIHGALQAARLAENCPKLLRLICVSTKYAHMRPGAQIVAEELESSTRAQANDEFRAIVEGGCLIDLDWTKGGWAWDYSYTKHLVERLLTHNFEHLPLCIVRPSVIGPSFISSYSHSKTEKSSVAEPEPLWEFTESMPVSNFIQMAIASGPKGSYVHCALNEHDGYLLFDEIPIDFVANILLAHLAYDTRGIVNACMSDTNPTQSLGIIFEDVKAVMPKQFYKPIPFYAQKGLANLFRIFGLPQPLAQIGKTESLARIMTTADHAMFPVNLRHVHWDEYRQSRTRKIFKFAETLGAKSARANKL